MLVDFASFSAWMNAGILLVAGIVVWRAGAKLSLYADAFAERTRLARALAGALLLGGATSLPELATTLTASAIGNAPMAVGNLFGGVAMQVALLAVMDLVLVRGALTYFSPKPVLLLAGVLLILQVALALAAVASGDVVIFFQLGLWPIVLTGAYLLSLYFLHRYSDRDVWVPADLPDELREDDRRGHQENGDDHPLATIGLFFALCCVLVLVGGWAVSSAADALSKQFGISGSFIGATLVALATSLPEVSTTAGAIRLGAYTMAISNIFGTNTLEVALLLPADLVFREGAIVNHIPQSAVFLGAIGIVLTALYLWGLLERRNKTVLRMGVDSAWVLATYLGGLTVMYFIS